MESRERRAQLPFVTEAVINQRGKCFVSFQEVVFKPDSERNETLAVLPYLKNKYNNKKL